MLYIIKDCQTDMKIVLSADASITVRHAAREFQHFVREMTNVTLEIITDDKNKTGPEICIGYSSRTESLSVLPDEQLGEEGYVIKVIKGDLVLAGNDPRGSLYAVYSLLEDYCGCRWYSPACSHIPECSSIRIDSDLDISFKPVFEYRETNYHDASDGDFSVRNRLNGHHHRLKAEHGGNIRYGYFVHSFSYLVPHSEYFATHPEYFALRDGVREDHPYAQLCLTNPDVYDISLAHIFDFLKKDPAVRIISISQNDGTQPCTCADCQAIVQAEGSEAGPILRFVNRLAAELEKKYPDLAIDTLAYDYSRKVPKITKPRPNVIIRLCSFECCFAHPLAECRIVAESKRVGDDWQRSNDFAGDLEKWSEICNRLYVWDYVVDFEFYQNPHPNLQVLADNIKFFANNNVKGVFEESNAVDWTGEMAQLRAWLLAKLLWNPDFDVDAGIDEFLAAWVGPAAAVLREYLDLMRTSVLAADFHLSLGDPPNARFITADILAKADRLFDQAEELTKDLPTENKRVRKERLGIRLAWFFYKGAEEEDRAEKADQYMQDAKELGSVLLSQNPNWKKPEIFREILIQGVWPPALAGK